MESAAQPIADSKYRLLDQLLDMMLAGVPQQVRSSAANDPKAARLVLESVDKTLVEHNFVFPPQGLVDSFGDAMIPHNVDASVMAQIVNRPANQRRRPAIRDNDTHIFYYSDGKTKAIFYLAIADVLNVPIYLVEIPGGNCVRGSSGRA